MGKRTTVYGSEVLFQRVRTALQQLEYNVNLYEHAKVYKQPDVEVLALSNIQQSRIDVLDRTAELCDHLPGAGKG